jgi:hypothetical protein
MATARGGQSTSATSAIAPTAFRASAIAGAPLSGEIALELVTRPRPSRLRFPFARDAPQWAYPSCGVRRYNREWPVNVDTVFSSLVANLPFIGPQRF